MAESPQDATSFLDWWRKKLDENPELERELNELISDKKPLSEVAKIALAKLSEDIKIYRE